MSSLKIRSLSLWSLSTTLSVTPAPSDSWGSTTERALGSLIPPRFSLGSGRTRTKLVTLLSIGDVVSVASPGSDESSASTSAGWSLSTGIPCLLLKTRASTALLLRFRAFSGAGTDQTENRKLEDAQQKYCAPTDSFHLSHFDPSGSLSPPGPSSGRGVRAAGSSTICPLTSPGKSVHAILGMTTRPWLDTLRLRAMGAGASVAENADAGNQGKRPAGSTSNVNNGRRRRIEEKGGESRSLDPDVSRPRPQARALDRLSSRVLGFNKQSDDEGDDETESVIPERTRTEGQTSLAKGSSLDLRTVPSANFTSTSSSKVTDARLAGKAEVLRQTNHFGLGASSSTASGEDDDYDSGLGGESLAQLEACVRQSRLLLFSTHRSKDKDHCKGAGQCVRDTERALADYENGGSASSGRRRRSRKREREVRALCDAIKLHVLARLWQKVYGLLRAGEDQSISGSLAGGVLDLLESNLSVATGSAFTQWSVLPVKKYVRQLRDGLRLEEACRRGAGGQRANRSGISDETEIQRALELFNFNLDNDKKLHRKSLASSSSWEESAKHSVLWSAVTERRLVSLSRAAERDVRALRLEDELKRLLAKGSRSETDIAIDVGGTHTAEDSKGSVLGLKSPVLSLRELQSLLKSGEELLSSYAVDGKTKSPARLRPLLAVGEALLRCRCALERRGLRQKYDWPGFWLGDDADHFRALRGAEEMMRRAMWSLLGLPDSSKQSLLECGRQVYEWMRVNYGVQLRWDLEKTEHALGEFGTDGIFGFDGNRSKTLRLAFVESSAVVIQTAFRAYRARRDVNEALSRQRERLRMVKDNDGAAVVIQRHARKMLSRKRCEAMREEAEEEDRLSIKRFTQMSPSRLLRALLEEMGQNQGVSEPSRSNQGQDWKTRDTPFELARLVLKTSPVSEICRAFELCPRICWDKCALLLEEAPASLAGKSNLEIELASFHLLAGFD